MWEKKAGVFQQPLDAACFNPAYDVKTVLKWQLEDDLTGKVGDRLVLIFPIVKISWAEDKVFNDDASCHMAATRFGKNCSAHAQARAASSFLSMLSRVCVSLRQLNF
jgi:hypothetical protein